jgi:hypothetical protein
MTTNINQSKPTTNDLLDAIKRSGYLLETEIVEKLSSANFFVESNQVIKDPITGKSREIDLVAEYDTIINSRDNRINIKAYARIIFVFELKNNPYPMVMMTGLKWSPNIVLDEALREVITETNSARISYDESYCEHLKIYEEEGVFTQYCTFKKKKEGGKNADFMAWHPEEFHDGLMKIIQYCDEQIEDWDAPKQGKILRDYLYLPVRVPQKLVRAKV